jgi:soluble lytic murein transglycosylase-like protein
MDLGTTTESAVTTKAAIKIDQASTGKVYLKDVNKTPLSDQQYQFVVDLCNFHNNRLSSKTIFAIMKVESNFNLRDVSSTEDYGIMQVNKKYFQDYLKYNPDLLKLYSISLKEYNMFDFETNVIAGYNALLYWKTVSNQKGHTDLYSALAAYNQGFNYFKRGYSINNYPNKVKETIKNYE